MSVLAKQAARITPGQRSSVAPATRPARSAVVVRASQAEPVTGRRQFAAAGAAAVLATLAAAAPAHAFLGFGDDKADQEAYAKATGEILASVNAALAMDKDDPDKDAKVAAVRTGLNGWVARYRRDTKFSGRPSYSNTYSVLNALAGHYNSFGPGAPIPKKRLERITKELADAEALLARGR